MKITFRAVTPSKITVQVEDLSEDGIEPAFRMTAFMPKPKRQKGHNLVQFAFDTLDAAQRALNNVVYLREPLKNYQKHLMDPEQVKYL